MGPLDLKCCQQRENLQVLHLEMSSFSFPEVAILLVSTADRSAVLTKRIAASGNENEMSFKLLNLRHAQKSKFREFLDQKPSNFFRRFLSFAFFFFSPLFLTLQVAAEGEERLLT